MTQHTNCTHVRMKLPPPDTLLRGSNGRDAAPAIKSPLRSPPQEQPYWDVTSISRVTDGRAWVEIDLTSIRANARALRSAANGARLLAVVKANAYGLGAAQIARTLEAVDPWGFAVATIDEGIALREAGVRLPILVLRPAQTGMKEHYRRHRLRPVVENPATIAGWELPFHVEIDTGMARTGLRWDEQQLLQEVGIAKPEGVFTHLHSADHSPESVELQWDRFQCALSSMRYRPPLLHMANSAGLWSLPQPLDLFRPGIFLYGGRPGPDLPWPEPVIALKAEIISVRSIAKGEFVSYGCEWRAEHDTQIATLGIGYADGVPRSLHGCGHVLINGRSCPYAGRVTMDMVTVNVGPGDPPLIGDVATLIGTDGDAMISLDQFANWSGTVSYEVLTRLGTRLPRVYIDA
jgi:alanine racemase